jgi:dipeptidyl-peptidase-4
MRNVLTLAIIITLVAAVTQGQQSLTIQDIFGSSKYSTETLSGIHWIDGGKSFSYQQYDSVKNAAQVWKYTLASGKREILIDGSLLYHDTSKAAFRYTSYQWSPDEQKVLFISAPPERQYLSRLTPAGNYFLYDLKGKNLQRLTNVSETQFNQKFSSDGSKLGFVRGNNIYYIDLAQGIEAQLTTDGAEHLINGKFDWVYEEEFSISDGWAWSPDGMSIAYWQLDESRVPEYHMIDFMTKRSEVETMRYPKPGDTNSVVRIGVVSLKTKKTVWMDIGKEEDIYIPRMQWFPDGKRLLIQRLNRLQNKLELLEANVESGTSSVLLTEESKTWIEEGYEAIVLKSSKQLFRISDKDRYAHIYLVDIASNKATQITKGEWEVEGISGIDEDRRMIYFTASVKTPIERHFYSIRFDGSGMKQLTADGFMHTPNLAPDRQNFLDTYSKTNMPPKIAIISTDGKKNQIVEENINLAIANLHLAPEEFFQFPTSDGVVLNASMIKPPDFNQAQKYPLLVYVYGGPNSQNVSNSWGRPTDLWHHMLAQKGYIVAKIDGRGTGKRGKEFRDIVYKNLGKWEVHDQCDGVKYLISQSFIDSTRVGIWGWSYGGYLAVSSILRANETFKTAVAVAPVTDWRLYDDIYTERYMGLPAENPDGYRESSALSYVDRLQGNLLIAHGTTDDNVHWQNTMQLVDALQKSGKHFDMQFYVNRNHGITGGNTRVHLFETITKYLLEKL